MSLTNPHALYQISLKDERKIIGLMSGTSLDGLDIALCTFSSCGPTTEVKVDQFQTIPYTKSDKQKIREIFAKQQVNLQDLCILNVWLGTLHGNMVLQCLNSWNISNTNIDLIASHGQTVFHSPQSLHGNIELPNATLQLGDGDHVAVTTGIITVSDFRQKNVAAGGEGAPLALYGDYFVFSKKGENRIMLNIGGIANITCLYGDLDANKAFATDLGPGNTLIDAVMRIHFSKDFDEDGQIAQEGQIHQNLLKSLKNHNFFSLPYPKTTGPELFNINYVKAAQISSNSANISPHDIVATLTKFSAENIAEGILKVKGMQNYNVYSSGGGAHNPVLMNHIKMCLPGLDIKTTDELGISGDAKEAVLFATLANETVCGLKRTDFSKLNKISSVSMGKISFPG